MKKIINQNFSYERALYNLNNTELFSCRFEGEEDGESALKEASNIEVNNCFFDLRYPFWHNDNININNTTLSENCRACLWYSNDITISSCSLLGIKAIRECDHVEIINSEIVSDEFAWKSNNIKLIDSSFVSSYFLFESNNIFIKNITFEGKYSFQYVNNLEIINSKLTTKDAFWHAKNVIVKDSILIGEYLGWYSENLTLINCIISGTQPLCYCKNLTLIDCEMIDCDLAFEYSQVNANIIGKIKSIKNPLSGEITCDSIDELIIEKDSKYPSNCIINRRK